VVKTFLAASLLLLIAVPALAQDDFPRVEMGFGYANLGLPGATPDSIDHHGGFAMTTGFNFTPVIGLDNYTGYYSLGEGSTLFMNIFGGKLSLRKEKITPFVIAGIGGAQVTIQSGGAYYNGGSALAARLGGGIDYRLNDVMAIRLDVTKMQVHSAGWIGKANVAVGMVFTIMQ
jgi:hypothetical protein